VASQKVSDAIITNGQEIFAVNPSSERESDVRPRELAVVGGPGSSNTTVGTVNVQREFWYWVLPAVLLLLLFEWWWFHRRT
jgi:hypothetical protein